MNNDTARLKKTHHTYSHTYIHTYRHNHTYIHTRNSTTIRQFACRETQLLNSNVLPSEKRRETRTERHILCTVFFLTTCTFQQN
jgi:hypothetical protein